MLSPMDKKRSAYEIPPARIDLSEEERRKAIEWWQNGEMYHPLLCPVCGKILSLSPRKIALECPTRWCRYSTEEIPWGVFAAWQREFLQTPPERAT